MSAEKNGGPNQIHIVVEDVTKRFGDHVALDQVSLDIPRGETVVIIGGSGAGKTTLLKLLIGLEKPSSGKILVDGVDIVPLGARAMNKVRRKFGMVFQYAALLDSLNVLDNVAFPLREHTRLSAREIEKRVDEKLTLLELPNIGHKFPSELSGGMRKRVGLARALMLEPEIIVYDEPTSGLDPLTSRLVDKLIKETSERFGVTSVVISHDMTSALQIADRIFILSNGQLVGEGSPQEILAGKVELANEFLRSSGISTESVLSGSQ
ncbi:MAG: ABC transporter ATP-binding protein [Polyangiaceae bacterium]|nr:ABC transporter ATP-binding protein [Polyangiaceae bacterium]